MNTGIEWDALSADEKAYMEVVTADRQYPTLEQVWSLIDAAWAECDCDPMVMDERISNFYRHPVWLLNGMFIEQHEESLQHRKEFADYVAGRPPARVADFGGGFGTLARMVAKSCPGGQVDIVEPYPRDLAVELANQAGNVSYVPSLQGEYDLILATDVFEHVPDPLGLVESTAAHLREGGEYLMANCFWPVIRCHLPSTFHFRLSWVWAMAAMNLVPGPTVSYGRIYTKQGPVLAQAARQIEQRSRHWFSLIEHLPESIRGRVARLAIARR